MKETVTTLPGSLGVNPPQWTTAHKDVPPEWLSQEGHPCMIGGRHGTMEIVNDRLVCVVSPSPVAVSQKEATTSRHHAMLTSLGYTHVKDIKQPDQTLHVYHSEHSQLHSIHKYLTGAGYDKVNTDSFSHRWDKHSGNGDAVVMTSGSSGGHQITHAQPGFNKESTKMDMDVITEGTNLHFTSASRTQIAKAHVYFDVRRRQVGLDNVRVSKIQGVQGNWFFDVSSHENNQFLDPNRLHNILPADVTVTASAPPTPQTASQDEVRDAIREMVEKQFDKLNQTGESEGVHERSSKVLDSNEIRFKNGTHRISLEQSDGSAHSIHHSFRPNADMLHPSPSWHNHGTVLAGTDEKRARNLFFHAVHSAKASHSMGGE